MRRTILIAALILGILLLVSLGGCSKRTQKTPEAPVSAEPVPAASTDPGQTQEPMSKPDPPKPGDVRAVVARVFQTAVTVDAERPYDYMVGDFNGDGSQDIAIVVKPVEASLPDINSEVSNWILEDPTKIPQPDPTKAVQPLPAAPPPVVVQKTDTLLAIVHGVGPEGWRSPLSRQTYLLKGAVGTGLAATPAGDLVKAAKTLGKTPRLSAGTRTRGDVLKEALNGANGYIYYTGAKYVWFP